MPRPLYLFKTITEQDQAQTCEMINSLCGQVVNLSDKALKCLSLCLKHLTNIDMPGSVVVHTVDLGVRTWNDLNVSKYLISMGFYLQAIMVLRDVVETIVVIEYLHTYPQKSDMWWKATTLKERRSFGINSIYAHIEQGHQWKSIWEDLSSHIHPNSQSVPIYAADKPFFGHNLFLGGFYYPKRVEYCLRLQLQLCITFTNRITQWYKEILKSDSELISDVDSLEDEYENQVEILKSVTEAENKEVVDKIVSTRLSKEAVIEWFIALDNLS